MFLKQRSRDQSVYDRRLRFDDQAGDTIVEVLIALAIISFILVTAYATTMRNTQQLQNNAERVQAQHLVEGQIEALKAANGLAGGTCFGAGGAPASGAACAQTTAGSGATYTLSITNSGGTYNVQATWVPLGSSSTNSSVIMYYRL
jgi:prepilin-type N-terminal cleavage/methylation domain-containing protein